MVAKEGSGQRDGLVKYAAIQDILLYELVKSIIAKVLLSVQLGYHITLVTTFWFSSYELMYTMEQQRAGLKE